MSCIASIFLGPLCFGNKPHLLLAVFIEDDGVFLGLRLQREWFISSGHVLQSFVDESSTELKSQEPQQTIRFELDDGQKVSGLGDVFEDMFSTFFQMMSHIFSIFFHVFLISLLLWGQIMPDFQTSIQWFLWRSKFGLEVSRLGPVAVWLLFFQGEGLQRLQAAASTRHSSKRGCYFQGHTATYVHEIHQVQQGNLTAS